ncbi:hypothetical protein CHUAL_010494 [Chamberlinius hualienensis]
MTKYGWNINGKFYPRLIRKAMETHGIAIMTPKNTLLIVSVVGVSHVIKGCKRIRINIEDMENFFDVKHNLICEDV